jgi:hypothetical protein
VAKNQGITNNEVSKEIGRMWHEEPIEVRMKFQKMAEAAKQEHMKKYPEYRYRPRRPQERKRRIQPRDTPPRRGSTPNAAEKLPMLDASAFVSSNPSTPSPRRVSSISNDDNSDIYIQSPTMAHNLLQSHQQQMMYANQQMVNSPPESLLLDASLPPYNYAYISGIPNTYDQNGQPMVGNPMGQGMYYEPQQPQQPHEEYMGFEDYDDYEVNGYILPEEEYRQHLVKYDYSA